MLLHLILEGSRVSVIRRSGLLPLLTIGVTDISPVKGIIGRVMSTVISYKYFPSLMNPKP